MLCSKCFEKIKQEEEVQVKDSAIICKECLKKPVAYCFTCYPAKALYYNDIICESSRNWSKKSSVWWLFSSNSNGSEKVSQCIQCYWEWRISEERWEIYSKATIVIIPIILLVLLGWILHVVYPDKVIKFFQEHESYCILTFLLIFFCFISYLIGFVILLPNRHKIKKRKRK